MLGLVASIAIWTGIVVGSLLLLALMVPLRASAAGVVEDDELDASAEVSWGWGLLALRWNLSKGAAIHLLGLRLVRVTGSPKKDTDEDRAKAKKKRSKDKRKNKRGLAWFTEHRRTLLRLAGRLTRALGLRGQLWLRIGLDDPAHTAGLVQALAALDRVTPGLALWVEPEYLEETLQADGRVALGLWLPKLAGIVLARLLFDGSTRALLKPVRA